MNYIAQLNAFDDWAMINRPSTGQYALYLALLQINNKCGWKEWFAAPNSIIDSRITMTKQGIAKAREYLSENGLIEFRSRNGNQATLYKIISIGQIVAAPVATNESMGQIVAAPVVAELPHQLSILKQETKTETKNNSVPKTFALFQNEIGLVSSMISQQLQDDVETYGDETVCDAIKEAVKNGVRKYVYVSKILNTWHTSGRGKSNIAKSGQAAMTLEEWNEKERQSAERISKGWADEWN